METEGFVPSTAEELNSPSPTAGGVPFLSMKLMDESDTNVMTLGGLLQKFRISEGKNRNKCGGTRVEYIHHRIW